MADNAATLNKGSDVNEEDQEQRLNELYEKKDLTDEEKKEFNDLKSERKNRYQKRLDKMKSESLAAKHEADMERQKREELEKRFKVIEDEKKVKSVRVIEETIEIDGKHYPTDRALKSMVEAGELSDEEAWSRKDERDKEEIVWKVTQKNEQKRKENESQEARANDFAVVLKKYPNFNKNHPDFDPDDPLYKETNRLWENGYKYNPNGLSEAVRDAKKILRMTDDNPDVSDDLNLRVSRPSSSNNKNRDVEMLEAEKEYAVKIYSNKINPKTGKTYTAEEAVVKAKKAKEAQLAARRA